MGNLMIGGYYPPNLGDISKIYCGSEICWPAKIYTVNAILGYNKVYPTDTTCISASKLVENPSMKYWEDKAEGLNITTTPDPDMSGRWISRFYNHKGTLLYEAQIISTPLGIGFTEPGDVFVKIEEKTTKNKWYAAVITPGDEKCLAAGDLFLNDLLTKEPNVHYDFLTNTTIRPADNLVCTQMWYDPAVQTVYITGVNGVYPCETPISLTYHRKEDGTYIFDEEPYSVVFYCEGSPFCYVLEYGCITDVELAAADIHKYDHYYYADKRFAKDAVEAGGAVTFVSRQLEKVPEKYTITEYYEASRSLDHIYSNHLFHDTQFVELPIKNCHGTWIYEGLYDDLVVLQVYWYPRYQDLRFSAKIVELDTNEVVYNGGQFIYGSTNREFDEWYDWTISNPFAMMNTMANGDVHYRFKLDDMNWLDPDNHKYIWLTSSPIPATFRDNFVDFKMSDAQRLGGCNFTFTVSQYPNRKPSSFRDLYENFSYYLGGINQTYLTSQGYTVFTHRTSVKTILKHFADENWSSSSIYTEKQTYYKADRQYDYTVSYEMYWDGSIRMYYTVYMDGSLAAYGPRYITLNEIEYKAIEEHGYSHTLNIEFE